MPEAAIEAILISAICGLVAIFSTTVGILWARANAVAEKAQQAAEEAIEHARVAAEKEAADKAATLRQVIADKAALAEATAKELAALRLATAKELAELRLECARELAAERARADDSEAKYYERMQRLLELVEQEHDDGIDRERA